ncbi:MAG: hypothetical protein R3F20_08080 [Planctomycetota bacterium]
MNLARHLTSVLGCCLLLTGLGLAQDGEPPMPPDAASRLQGKVPAHTGVRRAPELHGTRPDLARLVEDPDELATLAAREPAVLDHDEREALRAERKARLSGRLGGAPTLPELIDEDRVVRDAARRSSPSGAVGGEESSIWSTLAWAFGILVAAALGARFLRRF